MRNFYFIGIFTALFFQLSKAQFTESFESGIPATWTVVNVAGSSPNTWVAGTPGDNVAQNGSQVALITFDPAQPHNDWLITPPITITAGVNGYISFWAKNQNNSFRDRFSVRLSTTGTAPANFTVTLASNLRPFNTWTNYEFNLNSYNGQTIYIAIHNDSPVGTNEELNIDNFVNYAGPACPPPSGATVTATTTTTATLSWTNGGSETQWQIEYGPQGFTQGTGTTVNATSNPFTLTGLTANTNYSFYLRANCGVNGFSTWIGPVNFSTPCMMVTFPFVEGFNHNPLTNTDPPPCWQNIQISGTTRWEFVSNNASSPPINPFEGTGMARFRFSNNHTAILVTPPINFPTHLYRVRFRMHRDTGFATFQDRLIVYVNLTPSLASATQLGVIHRSTSLSPVITTGTGWYEYKFNLPPIAAGPNRYIILQGISTNGNTFAIDQFSIEPLPSCPEPEDPTMSAITSSTATASWTASPVTPANGYDWEVRTSGAPGSGPVGLAASGNTASTSVNITGLSPTTNYIFYVRSNCSSSDQSPWVQVSFQTACAPVTPPVIEGFNHTPSPLTTPPTCWLNTQQSGTGLWQFETSLTNPTITPFEGSRMATFRCYTYPLGTTANLITIPLNLPTDQFRVRFRMFRDSGFPSYLDRVRVLYNTAPTPTGATQLGVIHRSRSQSPVVSANGWYRYTFNFPSGSAGTNRYIIFQAISEFGNNIAIDDVRIEPIPSCPEPSSLNVTGITGNSANVSWTAPPTPPAGGYDWELRTSGLPGSGPTGLVQSGNTTATTLNLTGLNPITNYVFYVRSFCSSSDQSPWESFAFQSGCGAIATYPHIEPFNTFLPNQCWTRGFGGNLTAGPSTVSATAGAWSGGNWRNVNTPANPATKINIYGSNLRNDWLISPTFAIPNSGTYQLKFDVAVTQWLQTGPPLASWDNEDYVQVLVTTSNSLNNWQVLHTFNNTNVPSHLGQQHISNLAAYAGQNVRFAFRAFNGPNNNGMDIDFHVDNFVVEAVPTCFPVAVSSITSSNITPTTATISWSAPSPPPSNGYEYEVRTSGAPGSGPTGLVTSGTTGPGVTTVNLTGLPPNTQLQFYVRGNCGTDGFSTWSLAHNFRTSILINCPSAFSQTFCYANNQNVEFVMTTSNGESVVLTINEGFVENNWDELIILDTDGTEIYNGYGNAGNLAGLTFVSTGPTITLRVTPDGVNSCQTNSYTPISFTAACAGCVSHTYTLTPVQNCASNSYFVNVNITNMGSASALTINTNPPSTPQTVTSTGTYQVGPFPSLQNVQVTVTNNNAPACSVTKNITFLCNDECNFAQPLTISPNTEYNFSFNATTNGATPSSQPNTCMGNSDDDVWFSFVALSNLHFIDFFNVTGATMNINHAVYSGDCGNLTLLYCSDPNSSSFNGYVPGQTYYIRVWTDGPSPAWANFVMYVRTQPVPPPNDTCPTAITAAPIPFTDTQDAIGATQPTGPSGFITACPPGMNDGVWYTFTGNGQDLVLEVLSDGWSAKMGVFTGSCTSLSCVAAVDEAGENEVESIVLPTINGQQYFVNIGFYSHLFNGNEGPYTFKIYPKPEFTPPASTPPFFAFGIYPNPAVNQLNVFSVKIAHSFKIYNMLGQILAEIPANGSFDNIINTEGLSAGAYILTINYIDGTVSSHRFIKVE